MRFHYYDADFAFFWEVDNVLIGQSFCDPVGGGLLVGTVGRTLDDAGVVGARVSNVSAPQERGTSVATSADPALPDGFYWLFSRAEGASTFEATARNYSPQTRQVTVRPDAVTRADFELASGALMVEPTELDTELVLGEQDFAELSVTNTGDAEVSLEITEAGGGFTLADGSMSMTSLQDLTSAAGAEPVSVPVDASYAALGAAAQAPTESESRLLGIGTQEEPWVDLPELPEATLDSGLVSLDGRWYSVGGNRELGATDAVWVYDPAAMEWIAAAPLPEAVAAPAVAVVQDTIVAVGGWTDTDVTAATWIYDPAEDSWTAGADAPVAASAQAHAVHDGQVYVVGGCSTNDCVPMLSTVTAYDLGTDSWIELGDYPEQAAFGACSSLSGSLYCAGGVNSSSELSATYAMDDDGMGWTEVSPAPATVWGAASAGADDLLILNGGIQDGDLSNATWAYDAATDEWLALPASRTTAYRGAGACGFVRVGGLDANFEITDAAELLPGLDACNTGGGMDVPWLSAEPTTAGLAPGESVSVGVTTDGAVPQPGVYTAALRIAADVPEGAVRVPVTMTALPPAAWGKLLGSVLGADCEGEQQPLADAGVLVDPTSVPDFPGWYLRTDTTGDFATWFDSRVGSVDVTATKDGYRPGRQDGVQVPRGGAVRTDFSLLLGSCALDPGPIVTAVERLAGADRYLTAVEVSSQFDAGVPAVYLATGAQFPDALGAAARAGSLDVPLLLTRGDRLPAQVRDEIRRLAPEHVYVLGGSRAVADDTLDQVQDAVPQARVRRVGGKDRYETASLVAGQFAAADTVFVATGENYPDALAGAAAAGAPERIVVLGGEAALSEQVQQDLAAYATLEQIAGADRYETAVLLAADTETAAQVLLASGENWPDGLTGAALAGHLSGPLSSPGPRRSRR
ncbi:MAG: cell wall-binding repeat-containing protein [Ornithinimicrobium sp.]|uniref:cell wall-binding repeat-containing protein n=1 Tax=Ornithinimicrobium sp. TaxID=1977084 RepID=UPI003D9BCF37